MSCSATLSEVSGGYFAFSNVRALGVSGDTGLGKVQGDDAHCRAVCSLVPGCNTISRDAGAKDCMLSATCVADRLRSTDRGNGGLASRYDELTPISKSLRDAACRKGAVSFFASECREQPKWLKLSYRVENEGTHIEQAKGTLEQCRRMCQLTPGCNGFRCTP